MLKSDLLKMIDAAVVDSRKPDMIRDILEMNETDLAKVNAFILPVDAAFTEKDYFSRQEVIDVVGKMIQKHHESMRRKSESFGYRYRGSSRTDMLMRDLGRTMSLRDVRRVFTNENPPSFAKRKKRMIEEAKKNRLE